MESSVLKIHPADNVLVALRDLGEGESVRWNGHTLVLREAIPAKHKLAVCDLEEGQDLVMYGVLVGKAGRPIAGGTRIRTENTLHASSSYQLNPRSKPTWVPPDISRWIGASFQGYIRSDGRVGTANYWLVVPLVFCENRNLEILRAALTESWGYAPPKKYHDLASGLARAYRPDSLPSHLVPDPEQGKGTIFPNVDGIRFLTHTGGCGGTRQDAQALCGLLAGYITHPNIAGATVLSLGCQHAQGSLLMEEIGRRDPSFDKPLYLLEQQKFGLEEKLLEEAVRLSFQGMQWADRCRRKPAPLSRICLGLECGGSDGFSGISANPAIGHSSDLLVALGGSVILSEFPELCGVEQELCDRCLSQSDAHRFGELMDTYNQRAGQSGSGFSMNPSPGNIRDGLITDAIKSAGAAKKGGTSPVTGVLDYPEWVHNPGLHLLCTPGNDVESTTAEVAAGAQIVLFTTGLGTPTGNPVAPVIKISSNSALAARMPDIIDIDAGGIIEGRESIQECGERILDYIIAVASGETLVSSVRRDQQDFIPWKRGVSL